MIRTINRRHLIGRVPVDVKRRSTGLLMIMMLAAVPALSTAAPLDRRVRSLTDAEYLALDESFLESFSERRKEGPWKKEALPAGSFPHWMTADGVVRDVRTSSAPPPIGIEIVEPPGCPEISDSY
ncbi:hypothetical protein ACFOWE_32720 [Planomonospora corallina]|uniref:Uncharacterized protein n=1 Tax=Planomonospora corallina TaxID=1806052 RepID=A0ABV8IG25_9ACTN